MREIYEPGRRFHKFRKRVRGNIVETNSLIAALPDGRRTRMGDVLINSGRIRRTMRKRPIAVRLSERMSISHKYMLAVSSNTILASSIRTSVL